MSEPRVTPDVRADIETVRKGWQYGGSLSAAQEAFDRLLSRLDTLERERDEAQAKLWARDEQVAADARLLGAAEERLRAAEEALREIAEGSWNFGNLRPGLTVMEFARAALAGVQAPAGEDTP